MSVIFQNFGMKVKNSMDESVSQFLIEAAEEIRSAAARNSRVDSGQLKGSWRTIIGKGRAEIGSELENAIWEEFGTGEYAVSGGRKGGWRYQDAKGNWHFTRGKTPNHTLQRAFDKNEAKIKRRAEEIIKNGMA